MTVDEELGWQEYHSLVNEERKRAMDAAKAGGGKRSSRRR